MTNATIDKDSILSLIEDYNRQAEIERVDMLINNHINPTPVVDKVYQSFEESDINAICSYSFIDIDLTDLMTEEQVEEMDKIKMTGTIDDYSKEYDDKLNSLLGEDFIKEMIDEEDMNREEALEELEAVINEHNENLRVVGPYIEKYGVTSAEELRKVSLKWVLENPDMNTVTISMDSFSEVDAFVPLAAYSHRHSKPDLYN